MTDPSDKEIRELAGKITRARFEGNEVGTRAVLREMEAATRDTQRLVRSTLTMAAITFTGEELTFEFTGIDAHGDEVAHEVDADLFARLGDEAAEAMLAAAGDDRDAAKALIDEYFFADYDDEAEWFPPGHPDAHE